MKVAQLKRELYVGRELTLTRKGMTIIGNAGNRTTPDIFDEWRKVAKVQSNSVAFETRGTEQTGELSWLSWPKAENLKGIEGGFVIDNFLTYKFIQE